MAIGSGNSQMPHRLLRWPQMSLAAFVSPLVPLTASAKAFRHLLCRTWIQCQVPPLPWELQIENPLCHMEGKDDNFLPNHKLFLRCREKSTAESRKAQLFLLSRIGTAPSEASTNRQGSKGTMRTGTAKHWCLFLCASSTRCWRKGFFRDGEEKEEKWWSSRQRGRIRYQAHRTVKEPQNGLGGKGPATNEDVQQCWSHHWPLKKPGEDWGKESHWVPHPSPYPG